MGREDCGAEWRSHTPKEQRVKHSRMSLAGSLRDSGGQEMYVFIELGLVIVGLAVLARLASRWGFSAIPLYLLAGLAFGNGGLAPLRLSENFVRTGAEIGVLLLLFMLGLEYTGDELRKSLRLGGTAGGIDVARYITPR